MLIFAEKLQQKGFWMWDEIKKMIGTTAPALGTVLGGPAGGVVGGLIANALGVDEDPKEIAKALKDPKNLEKIKELEIKNKELINNYLLEMAKVKLEDKKSAREREIELAKANKKNFIQPLLATIGVAAFFGMVGYLIAFGLADMSKEASFIVGNLTGIAGAIAKDIYGYYFGSSQSSAEKTELLAKGR